MITLKGWFKDQNGNNHILDEHDYSLTDIILKLLHQTEFGKNEFEIEEIYYTKTKEKVGSLNEENYTQRVKIIITALTSKDKIKGWRQGDARPYFS